MRTKDFPGIDQQTSDQFALDVATDEQRILAAIGAVRKSESISLEALGFLLGVDTGQISRILNGTKNTTLRNHLRVIRALGYRCRVVLEKVTENSDVEPPSSTTKIFSHKVTNARGSSCK